MATELQETQVITKGKVLEETIIRLIKERDHIYFAIAWAEETKVFNHIFKNKSKIKYGVIGTSFCRTDPLVLEKFKGFDKVHFVTQSHGVFHPKLYFFESDNTWDIIIGSANMTNGAFTTNTEICLHFSNLTSSDTHLKDKVLNAIQDSFEIGYPAEFYNIENYKRSHESQKNNHINDTNAQIFPHVDQKRVDLYWEKVLQKKNVLYKIMGKFNLCKLKVWDKKYYSLYIQDIPKSIHYEFYRPENSYTQIGVELHFEDNDKINNDDIRKKCLAAIEKDKQSKYKFNCIPNGDLGVAISTITGIENWLDALQVLIEDTHKIIKNAIRKL